MRLHGQTNEAAANAIHNGTTNTIDGTDRSDNLIGTGANDSIWGGDGLDRMDGGAGNDVLFSFGGRDHLTGGSGDDLFLFGNLGENGGRPTIQDFQDGHDMIRLNSGGLDHDLAARDIDVRYNLHGDRAIVTVDSNGDGNFTSADWQVEVLGQPGMNLDISDFSIVNP